MQSTFISSCCKTLHLLELNLSRSLSRHAVLKPVCSPVLGFTNQIRSSADYKHSVLKKNNDISQSFVNFKIMRLIKGAIRECGPILEKNKKLQSALEKADKYNLPIDYINFALKTAVDNRAKSGIYELLFLNHGYFVVQYEDIDNFGVKHHLLKICNTHDAHVMAGIVKWDDYFDPKGIVSVVDTTSHPIKNETEAENIAKKIGATLTKKELDVDGWVSWRFYCEPGNLHKTKRLLQENSYEIEEAYVGFVSKRKIPLPGPAKHAAHSIICELSEIPAVENAFTNIIL